MGVLILMSKIHIKNRYLFLFDVLSCLLAYIAIVMVAYPLASFATCFFSSMRITLVTAIIYAAVLTVYNTYNTDWVNAGMKNYLKLIAACATAMAVSVFAGTVIWNPDGYPYIYPKLNIAANLGIIACVCAVRFFVRMINKISLRRNKTEEKRTLIIGAGQLAVYLLRDIQTNEHLQYRVVGLIDDNPDKLRQHICGTKVIGNRNDIVRLCEELSIEEIIFAIYTATPEDKKAILEICSKTGIKVKILQSFDAILNNKPLIDSIRDIDIEDLLGRDTVMLDNKLIENDINGKVVLVTGGGGSIGSELCRQILQYKPKKLIVFDIYENTTYDLQLELEEKFRDQDMDVIIGSVRDKNKLNTIFEKYRPQIVFHAAAHKHVPLMEYSPSEAIKNNVFGTYNVARCADEYGALRFVLISTDKAVRPTNIMGASKRMCEMLVQTIQKQSKTEYVAVRFGNVLGSNGSVIPRFRKQIASGGPVTVTHPEITRFFMTIPEAAQLVLQAASYAKGGEIFVLDMGEPVKIYDLAKKMISLSGYKPDTDIKIEFTGLRPGEKLYEELLMKEEGLQKTQHSKIFVAQPLDMEMSDLQSKLETLKGVLNCTNEEIKKTMSQVVTTYVPTDNK